MNLILRFFMVLIHSFRASRIGITEASTLNFRVMPNDLDFNGHMNNGRYLTLMDLGRIDALIRFGLFKTVMKKGWKPVLSTSSFRFRKSLLPFDRYQLVTRFACWDQKTFFIEQVFVRRGQVVGFGLVKGLFVANGKTVPTQAVLDAAGYTGPTPVVPESIRLLTQSENEAWLELDETRFAVAKKAERRAGQGLASGIEMSAK